MRTTRPKLSLLTTLLMTAAVLSGCASNTTRAPSSSVSVSTSPQVKAHQLRQRQRAIDGGYKRLYRPRDCRTSSARNCSGFPTFNP